MNFTEAMHAANSDGKAICRLNWNGAGQFVWFVPPGLYPARMEVIRDHFPDNLVPYDGYYALKNAQGRVIPWVPSQADLHAVDWVLTEVSQRPQPECQPAPVGSTDHYSQAYRKQHEVDLLTQLVGSLNHCPDGSVRDRLHDLVNKQLTVVDTLIK